MTDKTTAYKGLKVTRETLPAHFYLDTAHYEKELQAIWYRNWVYVCRADSLDEPRAFRTISIGTQSILVLRDENSDLQAFHNTCRHRGSVLCTENKGRLRTKTIICPYHAWTYSLQGELQRTPSKHCPAGFDKQNFPLYKVAIDEWNGFVFVNLSGEKAAPLADSFQQDSANLDNWPLSSLKLGHTYRKTMNCNWKIFWENFNECLHCPRIHPELCKMVPIYSRAYMEPEEDPNWSEHKDSTDPKLTGGMREGSETWTFDGQTVGKPFANLSEEERKAGYHYVVNQPSVFIAAHVDYVRLVRLLPLGTEKTELQVEWLFSEETLADKSIDIEKAAGFAKLVMQQDAFVSELNQKGLHCIQHKQGVLMAEEYDVYNFQNWVREQLDC
ncbi:MAG: Rieske 2Fe-2S domain-containing protein [Xanthomonadales bacterium]|nr:Rieske 2Fe-2S domain-containing protein [Xanthomonadales bacterium]